MLTLLLDLLNARLSAAARRWLDDARQAGGESADRARFLTAYTTAARQLGTAPLALAEAERRRVAEADAEVQLGHWALHDLGRAVLLLEAAAVRPTQAFAAAALECYDNGDAAEQQSWLRSLAVLPHPDQFVMTAIASCRTHIQPLFESTACENPYPGRHFPEPNFNQMVLKSLFIGVRLERIVGLDRRLNAELSRMALDYARERTLAHREVPPDIDRAIRPSDRART